MDRLTDEQNELQKCEDMECVSYLISEDMTKEQKLKALGDAYWQASNSGYCDAMANRLMSGHEDAQTDFWERNCRNKGAISRVYNRINSGECD